MYKTLLIDKPFIENKYHKTNEPFNAYLRWNYHGWECPADSGLSIEDIKEGLEDVSKKCEGLPHPVAKAMAVKYVLDNTKIDINEHDYFIELYTWGRETSKTTLLKWQEELEGNLISDEDSMYMGLFNNSGFVSLWPDFDHVVPNWDALLDLGLTGLINRSENYRKALIENGSITPKQTAVFDGVKITLEAVIGFIDRLYKMALTKTHDKAKMIANCLKQIRDGAPNDMYSAMQLMYIFFMISEHIDIFQTRSLGNGIDTTLRKYYDNDIKVGRYTREEIKELMGYFFLQFQAIGNYWGQPMYIAGSNRDGSTKVNNLTYDIVDLFYELGIYNPKIQVKYGDNFPKDLLFTILSHIRENRGSFVFCSEKNYLSAIMSYGVPYEEAFDYDISGCYETRVKGLESCQGGMTINLPKCVEYVFNNGYDKKFDRQVGLKTGEIEEIHSFVDFFDRVKAQVIYGLDTGIRCVADFERTYDIVNPSNLYTATIDYALKKGEDAFATGNKYCNISNTLSGLATFVDSMMAIKELVYDKKVVSLCELKRALDNNWKGYEDLREMALNSKHKYGNNDKETDLFSKAITEFLTTKYSNGTNARGGIYKMTSHNAMGFVWSGEKTLATPDGRKDGEEISKNCSPQVGMDREGVTALIKSAVNITPTNFTESCTLDVMLHPSAVSGNDGLEAMKTLLDVYFNNGGMGIQFNIFNVETLKDAQKYPDKYQSLQVRVCGWNVLWNNIPKVQQDAYIKRAENIRD